MTNHYSLICVESSFHHHHHHAKTGIPLFMGVLAEVGWITMEDGTVAHSVAAASVSVIALLSGLIFYAYTYRKWGPFLSNLKLDLHVIEDDSSHAAGVPGGSGLALPPHGGLGSRRASEMNSWGVVRGRGSSRASDGDFTAATAGRH